MRNGKSRERALYNAQSLKSKKEALANSLRVYLCLAEKPQSFSELLKSTGFSRPVLTKRLKLLQEYSIQKDTIKPGEPPSHGKVGTVVYRVRDSKIETFVDQVVEMTKLHYSGLPSEVKKKLEKHYEAIVKILSDYVKMISETDDLKLTEEFLDEG